MGTRCVSGGNMARHMTLAEYYGRKFKRAKRVTIRFNSFGVMLFYFDDNMVCPAGWIDPREWRKRN
jgi:hypothetical protein